MRPRAPAPRHRAERGEGAKPGHRGGADQDDDDGDHGRAGGAGKPGRSITKSQSKATFTNAPASMATG